MRTLLKRDYLEYFKTSPRFSKVLNKEEWSSLIEYTTVTSDKTKTKFVVKN